MQIHLTSAAFGWDVITAPFDTFSVKRLTYITEELVDNECQFPLPLTTAQVSVHELRIEFISTVHGKVYLELTEKLKCFVPLINGERLINYTRRIVGDGGHFENTSRPRKRTGIESSSQMQPSPQSSDRT